MTRRQNARSKVSVFRSGLLTTSLVVKRSVQLANVEIADQSQYLEIGYIPYGSAGLRDSVPRIKYPPGFKLLFSARF